VSNRKKSEIVNDDFGIQSFQGCHGEISPRDQFMPKCQVYPDFPNSGTWPSFNSHNSKTADRLEP
jgi:hypothetical protein